MEFFGRENEKKRLSKMIFDESQNLCLIYGRRRIGKSELIKQVLRENAVFDKSAIKSVYYECKQTSEKNNVESFSEIVCENLDLPKLVFSDFEEVLKFLFKQGENQNLIVVLDEYPYLREIISGLDSILQSLVDKYKEKSKTKLIICGSYIETMKNLLSEHNPLFGRVDLSIDLKPMDYFDSALFYKDFSDEDKIRLYSVFGGIPYYNRLIDSKKSVKENIIDLIASNGARLENEVVMYLKSEISKITNANEVFEALSKGFSKFSDILSQSHVSSSPTLVDVLEKLVKMEVVKKESPINDENNKKKCGYFISDSLSLFYFKYIFRNLSRLNVMDSEVFYEKFISEDFEKHYVPHFFETICKQFLIRKNRLGELENSFEKIGKYFYNDSINKTSGEFDVVTENDGEYIFYESKFRNEPLSESRIFEEIKQVQNTNLKCKKFGFFSKSGFEEIREEFKENLILFELKDLF